MAPEYSLSSNLVFREKRKRKVFNLAEKMNILKKIEQGRRYSSLAREYGCNESSIRTIKKCEQRIKTSFALMSSTNVRSVCLSRRDTKIEQMENLLNVWIDEQTNKNVPLSANMIRSKALSIYENLKRENPSSSSESSFCASKGWFDRFRKRANLHNVCVVSEGVSPDGEGAEFFKRITCWAKLPVEDDSQKNIHTEIEKIINLSNMIEKEKLSDKEKTSLDVDLPIRDADSDATLSASDLDDSLDDQDKSKSKHARDVKIEIDNMEDNELSQVETESTSVLEILKAAEYLKDKILQEDTDLERSAKVRTEIDKIFQCYYTATSNTEFQEAEEFSDSIAISLKPDPDSSRNSSIS